MLASLALLEIRMLRLRCHGTVLRHFTRRAIWTCLGSKFRGWEQNGGAVPSFINLFFAAPTYNIFIHRRQTRMLVCSRLIASSTRKSTSSSPSHKSILPPSPPIIIDDVSRACAYSFPVNYYLGNPMYVNTIFRNSSYLIYELISNTSY